MKPNNYKELKNIVKKLVEDKNYFSIENKESVIQLFNNPELKSLMANINGFFYIFNYSTGHYEHVSENLKTELGYDPAQMTGENGVMLVYSIIDEKHSTIIMNEVMKNVLHYFSENSTKDSGTDYRFTTCIRMKNIYNQFHWYLLDTHIVQTDNNGFPLRSFVTATNISLFKKDEVIYYNILKKDKNGIYETVYQGIVNETKEENKLTKRELEIIRMIGEGYTNAGIAEHLFISLNTVQSHRKNILKKTECKGTAELTKYAYSRGII